MSLNWSLLLENTLLLNTLVHLQTELHTQMYLHILIPLTAFTQLSKLRMIFQNAASRTGSATESLNWNVSFADLTSCYPRSLMPSS